MDHALSLADSRRENRNSENMVESPIFSCNLKLQFACSEKKHKKAIAAIFLNRGRINDLACKYDFSSVVWR